MSRVSNNLLLKRLAPDDLAQVEPFLERVDLELGQNLILPGEPVTHVWFPETGMVSLIAGVKGSEEIEVSLVGYEGMTDHVAYPGDVSGLRCLVQMSGSALAVEAQHYANWLHSRPDVFKLVVRYQQFLLLQFAHTALSHGSFNIVERLARWLLMSFDRSNNEPLPLVHDSMAMMLAVRRSGVTNAIHVLEGHGAINASRKLITLRDREILKELAAGSYGTAEAEYARLMAAIYEPADGLSGATR
jgi:CRP-like cAMP-binding protein